MIDTNQLSALISAFRVETEKESISPETVGKLLQDIVDLLATASTDAERQILDDWKTMLSQYIVVYDVEHATGIVDMEHMFLTIKGRSLRNGATFTSSVPLSAATDMQAGVMSASHVQAIMSLQTSLPQVRSAVTALQSTAQQHGWQLAAIQAAGYVVTDIRQGTGHASKINLSLTKHDVRTGEDFPGLGTCTIAAANTSQAGAMTVAHVTSLANAKTDISTLQAKMRTVQGAGAVVDGASVCLIDTNRIGIQLFGYNLATGEREIELQQFFLSAASQYGAGVMTARQVKRLNELYQAVFGGTGLPSVHSFFNFGIQIGMGKDELYLKGGEELVNRGFVPYLFRYSRKRNRTIDQNGIKGHGDPRAESGLLWSDGSDQPGQVGLHRVPPAHQVNPMGADILAPIAAAMAIAAGVMQVAAIKKQQQASQAQGYAEGGFTRQGRVDEVAGVVHAGEWVASQKLLASPVARPLIEALDYAQRTNTIGSLRSADVSRTITAPAVLAQSQAPTVIVQENNALRETLARLNERLNEPFVTVNTVTGDLGIKQAQDDYQRLMNNKSPKNKRR